MPYAVTHILIPLLIIAFIRDFILSKEQRKHFPLHYVLIAGLAGAAPDLDIAVYWVLHFFGFTLNEVHRTFTHSLLVPLLFLVLFFVFRKADTISIRKHKLNWGMIFLMISFGTFIHILLDTLLSGPVMLFYPFSYVLYGMHPFDNLPSPLNQLFLPCLDAALLVIWIVYLELKHKISDFI